MKFTSSVAAFAMILTDSKYKGSANYNDVIDWLNATTLNDAHNFKSEFKSIVTQAKALDR